MAPTDQSATSDTLLTEEVASLLADRVIDRLDHYAEARLGQRYLSLKEIAERFGISPRTAEKVVKEDHFPRPIKIRGQRRWSLAGVEAYEHYLAGGSPRG